MAENETTINIPALIEITPSKLELIKNTICKGATDDELALFKYICEKRQLDPFARQIYAIKRRQWNSDKRDYDEMMTIQTGIDGFRLIAERSGKYAGQLGPFFTEDGITWLDAWVKDTPPRAAKVAVIRSDFREPVWAMARFKAYCPLNKTNEPMGLWKTIPEGQIAKCAEALALRRAFPEELSGLYTSDEMHQAEPLPAIQAPSGDLLENEQPRAEDPQHDPEHEAHVALSAGSQAAAHNVDAEVEVVLDEPAQGEAAVSTVSPDSPVSNELKAEVIATYSNSKVLASKKNPRIQKIAGWAGFQKMTVGQAEQVKSIMAELNAELEMMS